MGPTMDTVPSSVASQSSGQIDPAAILTQILDSNKSNLKELAKKAATPIPGGHTGQMPLSMQQPQKDYQAGPMIPTQGIVGKGNARAAGIGNAIIGTTHTIAAVKTAMDNKKKVEIASSTQQLLQAQQAADQAKQQMDQTQDKNSPEYKKAAEQYQHNTEIQGVILTGKHGKDIMKGFNIDYTDPASNKTLQHDAVAMGKARAQAATEAFNKGTPTQMKPDTQAIAQYQAAAAQQKANTEAVRAIIPLLSAQMRSQSVDKRTDALLTREQIHSNFQAGLEAAKSQDAWDRLNAQIKSRQDLAKTQFGYRMSEIGAEGTKEIQVFRQKLEDKTSDPMSRLKAYNDFQTESTTILANLTKTIGTLEGEKQTALLAAKSGLEKDALTKSFDLQINTSKQALTSYQALTDANTNLYKLYEKEATSGDNKQSTGVSTESKPDKLDDPNSYITDDDSVPNDDEE